MTKKNVYLSLCLLFISIAAESADSTFTISGKFEKLKKGKAFLYIYKNEHPEKISAVIKNGRFKFSGIVKEPVTAVITLSGKRIDYFLFYLEPAKMSIYGNGDSLKLLTITGSPLNDDDKLLKKRLEHVNNWSKANEKAYSEAANTNNEEILDSLNEVDIEILKEKRKVVAGFVQDNPQSMRGALAIIENFAYHAEADEVEILYKLLDVNVKNSAQGKGIKKLIDVYNTVALGKVPPDFKQMSPEGKPISLSSLQGKYILVDFWASWCVPCRRENTNVVKAYHEFKDKGLDVLGVSYDTNKTNWLQAIKNDALAWQQVSDLLGWENATSELYGIKALPSNFLLDKSGRIVAKNIFGRKLLQKLSEVLL